MAESFVEVTKGALAANAAELKVAAWLSQRCLVRPVMIGTDIGVDLYCELVKDDRPWLHFWVQVKADTGIGEGSAIKYASDLTWASYCFKTKHLEYWERQPIPVFIMLVPRTDPAVLAKQLYVIDFTRWLLEEKRQVQGQTITSHVRVYTERVDLLEKFLDELVTPASFMLRIRDGVSSPLRAVPPQYITRYWQGYRAPFYREVVEQLRHTGGSALGDMAREAKLSESQERAACFLRDMVALHTLCADAERTSGVADKDRVFTEHYEDYEAIGRHYQTSRAPTAAITWYERSEQTIKNDPTYKANPALWQRELTVLEGLKDDCRRMLGA